MIPVIKESVGVRMCLRMCRIWLSPEGSFVCVVDPT